MSPTAPAGSEVTPSPDGRFAVWATPWEAAASQWVYHPRLVVVATGETLWAPADNRWSLERATWESDSQVRLSLRRFPGNPRRPFVEATVDCVAGIAAVGEAPAEPLTTLGQRLADAWEMR
ncbi:hypothetical protein [Arenimonas composti]|uniref:Uncharacterized protein n=1 Tax=Arenimonas composti TR7-09 = DSM 18010 TaxID=1121013 RepID=A0A091BCR3_9GAMM|nr:hypothetical protein [Arenimonas composti]KFN49516.1 hypothetical protein P873_10200 [Arenimonas composti TR7-09 = DSM 18010]